MKTTKKNTKSTTGSISNKNDAEHIPSTPIVMGQTDGILHRTKDYSIFKTQVGNREVLEKRVRKAIKSIEKVGWRVIPIVINRKHEVIDGQGRLEAARRLNLPVWYVFDFTAALETTQVTNDGQTRWRYADFIHSHAAAGNENYIALESLCKEFSPSVKMDVIVSTCLKNLYAVYSTGSISRGDFKMEVPLEVAKARCEFIRNYCDLPPSEKEGRGNFREFQQASLFMLKYSETDFNRMIVTVRRILGDRKVMLGTNVENNIYLLDQYYNKGLGMASRIDFVTLWRSRPKK